MKTRNHHDRILNSVLLTLLLWMPLSLLAETYSYDAAGRLTGVTYDDGSSITYSYDSAGNILQQQANAAAAPNNPPAAISLVSPSDGATGLETTLTLIWKKSIDPDGDTVSYNVIYCTDAGFSSCSPTPVAHISSGIIAIASAGGPLSGLFVLGMFFAGHGSRVRLNKQLALIVLAAVFFAVMTGCSGGGGSSATGNTNPVTPGADEAGFTITGLLPATTYFWKITANDGNGGSTESATWSFTT